MQPIISLNIYSDDFADQLGSLELTDHSDFPLALTWSTGDFTDITKRSGAYSKTFKVPASKLNNRVLEYIYNIGINFYNSRASCRAEVLCNGIPFFQGKLKINNVGQGTQPTEYDLELTGDNLDWVEYLKGHSVRDIDFGNQQATYYQSDLEYNPQTATATTKAHPYTEAYVFASWRNFPDKFDYVYGLKSYGAWKQGNKVMVEDLRPDVSIARIVNEAFRKAGYQLESNFCQTPFFKKLVLAYTGDAFNKAANANDSLLFKSILCEPLRFFNLPKNTALQAMNFPLPDCSGHFDNGNNYNGIIYTVPYRSSQQFILSGKITSTTWHENLDHFTIGIAKKSNNQIEVIGTSPTTFSTSGETVDITIDTGYMTLNAGDEIYLYFHYQTNGWVGSNKDPRFHISQLEFYNQVSGEIFEGDIYEVSKVLPDIKLMDVLAGLMNMFNLYFRTDVVSKKVYCEPRDQFLKPLADAFDWTGKFDIGKEATIQYLDDYKRDLTFKYKLDTKDAFIKERAENTKKHPGSFAHTLPEKYNPGKQELGAKEFAYTLTFQDWQILHPNLTNRAAPEIPRMWTELTPYPAASYDFTPRIMYYEGYILKSLPDSTGKISTPSWTFGPNGMVRVQYPVLTAVPLDYSNVHGLVNTYYKNTLAQIEDGRQVTAYFNLDLTDILNLDLQRPIFIDHPTLKGYYYITTIADYRPAKGDPVKVTLLPVLSSSDVTIDFSNQADYTTTQQMAPTLGRGTGTAERFNNAVLGANALTPSTVLNNGTGNWAPVGTASVAIGQGAIANARNQTILGAYNVVSPTDVIQMGGGTSPTDRYRALTFTQDGNFLVQGGYLYTTDGREIMFASQRGQQGQVKRFDKVHLKGNE